MATWGLAEAKAHFSEVVAKAMTEGPQEVSKGGKDAVVIVSKAEWERKTTKKYANAAEFFLQSPLRGSGLKLERRATSGIREVERLSYLLDTDALSQTSKHRPAGGVLAWLGTVRHESIFLSVDYVHESCVKRIQLLPQGRRRESLDEWLLNDDSLTLMKVAFCRSRRRSRIWLKSHQVRRRSEKDIPSS